MVEQIRIALNGYVKFIIASLIIALASGAFSGYIVLVVVETKQKQMSEDIRELKAQDVYMREERNRRLDEMDRRMNNLAEHVAALQGAGRAK